MLSKSGQSSTEVLLFLNVCPYVVKVNFVLQSVTPLRLIEKNTSGHYLAKVVLLLYVCPYIVVLDESDIALFTS